MMTINLLIEVTIVLKYLKSKLVIKPVQQSEERANKLHSSYSR